SSAGERVYRHNFAFVEPKPYRDIELTFNRVLARYLGHFSAMPVMALVLLASVFPLRFPFQNLRARDRHYFGRKLFEPLEWRFVLLRLWMLHAANFMLKPLLEQAVLNKIAPSLVLKMPVRFEVLARRGFNKVRFGQFFEMELGS